MLEQLLNCWVQPVPGGAHHRRGILEGLRQ